MSKYWVWSWCAKDTASSEWRKLQIHIPEIFDSTNQVMSYRLKPLIFLHATFHIVKALTFQYCLSDSCSLMHIFTSVIPLSFLELVLPPLCCLLHPSGLLHNPFHSTLSSFCQRMVHCDLHALCSKPVNIRVVRHIHTNETAQRLGQPWWW